MNAEQLREFTPFWTSQARHFVLVSINPAGYDLRNCGIVDTRGNLAVLIEDSDLALEVMQRMVEAGVEIVDKLPANVKKYVQTD